MSNYQKLHLWSPGFAGFGGGIGAFSGELANALNVGENRSVRLFGKQDCDSEWNGMRVSGAGKVFRPLRTAAFAARGMVSGLWDRPDHLVGTHINFGPALRLIHKYGRMPYTLVAHGVEVCPQLSASRRAALQSAARVIAVSQWTASLLETLVGVPTERIHILPNTYAAESFHPGPAPEHLRRRYSIKADEKIVMTVCRLDAKEAYKGYDRIVQSLSEVRQACGPVRFFIVGKGADRTRVETMARKLGLEDAVSLLGFVPDEELMAHYRLADVFAMPSTGEGFGIVFLEAMACGTPVLGGDLDGSVDALDRGKLGLLVNPTSVDGIAAGLIALLRREGPAMWFDRQRLSNAVLVKYGREAFRRRVMEIFPD